jgi:hypothetical protein
MADEDDANGARQQHRRNLMRMGVHSIGVEEGGRHGKDGWVVVAHIAPDAVIQLPSSLPYSRKDGEVTVPLVVSRSKPYKPE